MVVRQNAEKVTRSFNITEAGFHTLIETNKTIMIEDIIISKGSNDRITFRLSDGINENEILFLEGQQTKHMSFNHSLMFWTGANLEVVTGEGEYLVTIGYYIVDGDNFEKWRLFKQ